MFEPVSGFDTTRAERPTVIKLMHNSDNSGA
jgi:hypothetical protein